MIQCATADNQRKRIVEIILRGRRMLNHVKFYCACVRWFHELLVFILWSTLTASIFAKRPQNDSMLFGHGKRNILLKWTLVVQGDTPNVVKSMNHDNPTKISPSKCWTLIQRTAEPRISMKTCKGILYRGANMEKKIWTKLFRTVGYFLNVFLGPWQPPASCFWLRGPLQKEEEKKKKPWSLNQWQKTQFTIDLMVNESQIIDQTISEDTYYIPLHLKVEKPRMIETAFEKMPVTTRESMPLRESKSMWFLRSRCSATQLMPAH